MGGGLLQKINRDTQRFAFKSSAQCRGGVWYDIYKDPIEGGKQSKKGRLVLLKKFDEYATEKMDQDNRYLDYMKTVYKNGELLIDYNFNDVLHQSVL